jgi:hypothetical protein
VGSLGSLYVRIGKDGNVVVEEKLVSRAWRNSDVLASSIPHICGTKANGGEGALVLPHEERDV